MAWNVPDCIFHWYWSTDWLLCCMHAILLGSLQDNGLLHQFLPYRNRHTCKSRKMWWRIKVMMITTQIMNRSFYYYPSLISSKKLSICSSAALSSSSVLSCLSLSIITSSWASFFYQQANHRQKKRIHQISGTPVHHLWHKLHRTSS